RPRRAEGAGAQGDGDAGGSGRGVRGRAVRLRIRSAVGVGVVVAVGETRRAPTLTPTGRTGSRKCSRSVDRREEGRPLPTSPARRGGGGRKEGGRPLTEERT